MWDAVRARKEQTKLHYGKGDDMKPPTATAAKHMLTGLLRCGECGHSMAMIGSHRPRYFCLGRQHRGASFCSQKGSPMAALDKGVIDTRLDELLGDPERLVTIIKEREAARAVPGGPRGQRHPRRRQAGAGDQPVGDRKSGPTARTPTHREANNLGAR